MSRAAAVRRNQVVKGVDLGVENLKSSLALVVVLADGSGFVLTPPPDTFGLTNKRWVTRSPLRFSR
jgi:hypothetical protein